MIEGLTALTGVERGVLGSHKFSLPAGFPAKMSSKWVEDGPEVIEAAQPQILQQANVSAVGWTPYLVLDNEGTETRNEKLAVDHEMIQSTLDMKDRGKLKLPPPIRRPYVRVVGKKKFILLMRPRALQEAVNRIHADTSRHLVNQEIKGETAVANEGNDPGIITNRDLRTIQRYEAIDEGEDYLKTNAGGQPSRLYESAEIPVQ